MMRRQARSSSRITGRRELHDLGNRACSRLATSSPGRQNDMNRTSRDYAEVLPAATRFDPRSVTTRCPRSGGNFTLLFGPSTEHLCHLTPEHLKLGDKHAHLVLGRHPVLLPPRLAELLRHLAEQPQLRPQLSRVHPGPRWLFPGMVPGKPISTHGMTQKLGRHGIPVRTARNAALAALAADLPSPILADVTGMHRHTALCWVAYARRDWAEYLAARAEDEANKQERTGNGGTVSARSR